MSDHQLNQCKFMLCHLWITEILPSKQNSRTLLACWLETHFGLGFKSFCALVGTAIESQKEKLGNGEQDNSWSLDLLPQRFIAAFPVRISAPSWLQAVTESSEHRDTYVRRVFSSIKGRALQSSRLCAFRSHHKLSMFLEVLTYLLQFPQVFSSSLV